jgi:SOS-response transcriptional repressor LexA
MTKLNMTPAQARVLQAVRDNTKDQVAPTIRELARALGYASPQAVLRHLNALKARGHLTWTPGRYRSLTLL